MFYCRCRSLNKICSFSKVQNCRNDLTRGGREKSAISMSKTASSSDIDREEEEVDGSGSKDMVPLIFGTLLQLPDYSGRDVVGSEIILFLATFSRPRLSDRQFWKAKPREKKDRKKKGLVSRTSTKISPKYTVRGGKGELPNNYLLPKFFLPFVVSKMKIMYERCSKNILCIYANNIVRNFFSIRLAIPIFFVPSCRQPLCPGTEPYPWSQSVHKTSRDYK